MSVALPQPAGDRMSARNAVMGVALLIALAAVVAVFIGRGADSTGGSDPSLRRAASFSLEGLREGEPQLTLASTAGKPTVLNFFAAWCEPCKEELPALRAAAAAHSDVAFIGIDHKDSRDDAIELLQQFGINYPAGYDPRGEVAARYGVPGLPVTVFIDPAGNIVGTHHGAMSAKALEDRLRELKSGSTGA